MNALRNDRMSVGYLDRGKAFNRLQELSLLSQQCSDDAVSDRVARLHLERRGRHRLRLIQYITLFVDLGQVDQRTDVTGAALQCLPEKPLRLLVITRIAMDSANVGDRVR